MADVVGKTGSYGNLTPINENYLGDALKNIEDNGFKYRAEKRLIADKEEAKRKSEELTDDFNANVDLSGNQTMDDLAVPYAAQARDTYANNVRAYNATTDTAERTRLLQANNKIKQSFDVFKQVPTMLKAKGEEISKGIMEGKYSERDADRVAKLMEAVETGKAKITIDPYGQPRITTYAVDENGRITGVLEKDQTVADLVKSTTPHKTSQYDTLLKKTVDETPLDEEAFQKGANIYERKLKYDANGKLIPRIESKADAFANTIASDPGERYEIAAREGIDENDTEAIKAFAKKQFIDSLAKMDKQKLDSSILNYRETVRKNRKEEEKDTPVIGTGTFVAKAGQKFGVNLEKGSVPFAVKGAQRKQGEGKIETLKAVVAKPDGTFQYVVEETFEDEGTSSKSTVPNAKGKAELAKNPEHKLAYDEIEEVTITSKNKKPKTVVYDTKDKADDAENFAIILKNPKTGEYFSGLEEANNFFSERGYQRGLQKMKQQPAESKKQPTAEELIAKYSK
ncbi:MAG: hypothetical protein KBC56_08125 [Flavobacterium sp.]|nr:hypothetical protein [Flavobacterium sp.]